MEVLVNSFTTLCRECGEPFEARRSTASFCSGAHRAAHSRRDRAERHRRAAATLVADTQRVLIARGVAVAEGDFTAVRACDAELADIDRRAVELFGPNALAA